MSIEIIAKIHENYHKDISRVCHLLICHFDPLFSPTSSPSNCLAAFAAVTKSSAHYNPGISDRSISLHHRTSDIKRLIYFITILSPSVLLTFSDPSSPRRLTSPSTHRNRHSVHFPPFPPLAAFLVFTRYFLY